MASGGAEKGAEDDHADSELPESIVSGGKEDPPKVGENYARNENSDSGLGTLLSDSTSTHSANHTTATHTATPSTASIHTTATHTAAIHTTATHAATTSTTSIYTATSSASSTHTTATHTTATHTAATPTATSSTANTHTTATPSTASIHTATIHTATIHTATIHTATIHTATIHTATTHTATLSTASIHTAATPQPWKDRQRNTQRNSVTCGQLLSRDRQEYLHLLTRDGAIKELYEYAVHMARRLIAKKSLQKQYIMNQEKKEKWYEVKSTQNESVKCAITFLRHFKAVSTSTDPSGAEQRDADEKSLLELAKGLISGEIYEKAEAAATIGESFLSALEREIWDFLDKNNHVEPVRNEDLWYGVRKRMSKKQPLLLKAFNAAEIAHFAPEHWHHASTEIINKALHSVTRALNDVGDTKAFTNDVGDIREFTKLCRDKIERWRSYEQRQYGVSDRCSETLSLMEGLFDQLVKRDSFINVEKLLKEATRMELLETDVNLTPDFRNYTLHSLVNDREPSYEKEKRKKFVDEYLDVIGLLQKACEEENIDFKEIWYMGPYDTTCEAGINYAPNRDRDLSSLRDVIAPLSRAHEAHINNLTAGRQLSYEESAWLLKDRDRIYETIQMMLWSSAGTASYIDWVGQSSAGTASHSAGAVQSSAETASHSAGVGQSSAGTASHIAGVGESSAGTGSHNVGVISETDSDEEEEFYDCNSHTSLDDNRKSSEDGDDEGGQTGVPPGGVSSGSQQNGSGTKESGHLSTKDDTNSTNGRGVSSKETVTSDTLNQIYPEEASSDPKEFQEYFEAIKSDSGPSIEENQTPNFLPVELQTLHQRVQVPEQPVEDLRVDVSVTTTAMCVSEEGQELEQLDDIPVEATALEKS